MSRWARRHLVFLALLVCSVPGSAQQAADYFRANCTSCHTIGGGRLTGPDLKDVSRRRDHAWLVHWLQDPKAVLDSGDAYAQKLQQEARGIAMPATPGMNPALADELLALIDAESKLPKSHFAGTQISDRPFTPQDVTTGRQIFTGSRRLGTRGPACISCHTMKGLGGLSGGRLGPDLTLVYERLQGRKGLSSWLLNPASPTMAPVFRAKQIQPEEILPLVAFFEDAARKGGVDDSAARLNFLLLGLGGSLVGMVALDSIWKKRFRSVRRQLVHPELSTGNREVKR